jgi:hypothetical protein
MPSDAAAHAANWRRVLLMDAALGFVPFVVGLILRNGLGAFLSVAGLFYLCLVGRRYVRWRRLRAEAGLDS